MHINGIKERMIKTAKAEILCPAVFINPETNRPLLLH